MFASGKSASSSVIANYIEDVFSCFLETGAGTSFTINNGINLSTKGGMVWMKRRSGIQDNYIYDTARGANQSLVTNNTDAQVSNSQIDSFTTTGFTGSFLASASTNGFWTFRKQAKFFDVVTYTGNGSSITVPHSLGSTPGCIIVKKTNASATASDWVVYHRSVPSNCGFLNLTSSFGSAQRFSSVTSTDFTINVSTADVNENASTYVAYVFAHDAGGFGLTGTDNVISCGSFTTDASGNATVNIGYEPQWVMVKQSTGTDAGGWEWGIQDSMRGMVATGYGTKYLRANSSAAEGSVGFNVTSTGFKNNTAGDFAASQTFIYIAIRRGPMKVPTLGTSVFTPIARNGTGTNTIVTGVGFPLDLALIKLRSSGNVTADYDRLRGSTANLQMNVIDAEAVYSGETVSFDQQDGFGLGPSTTWEYTNRLASPNAYVNWLFRRAPSFFDEVCYTGTASYTTFTHNLTVAPQLVIIKSRSNTNAWVVGSSLSPSASDYIRLNSTAAWTSGTFWDNSSFVATRPTATTVTISQDAGVNGSGLNFVAYLFATCAGVSKVGSYTGTATTLQIDCGFTAGARFVLIKRTDSTGDWYVWDTARGIVSGNDPYLLLNDVAAEVTSTDYIDTYSAGFEISSTAPSAINASGGTFIFLAIA
jgi:hypothetical protein